VLTPSAAITAFAAEAAEPLEIEDGDSGQPAKVAFAAALLPANVTGQPALSVPGGFVDGLPIGVQVIGPRGADAAVLRAGMAFELVRGPFRRLPVASTSSFFTER
jgi:aspartyl-tRNA(Asn)/glutamyl-tRNA(Gln) amidotransferase subunit A